MKLKIELNNAQINQLQTFEREVNILKQRVEKLLEMVPTIETVNIAVKEKKKAEKVLCFVYGTLKVGGYYAEQFDGDRLEVKKCLVQGRLLTNDRYPMMLTGEGVVYGELHVYENAEAVVTRMDRIEGFNESDPDHSLFVRQQVNVIYDDGKSETAWAYFYNNETDAEKYGLPMPDGMWSKGLCKAMWDVEKDLNKATDEVRDGNW